MFGKYVQHMFHAYIQLYDMHVYMHICIYNYISLSIYVILAFCFTNERQSQKG